MSLAFGLAAQFAITVPLLIVYVVGLVMLQSRRDRLSPATVRYGVAGLIALMAHAFLGLASFAVVLTLPDAADAATRGAVTAVFSILEMLLSCIGVGLLIAALVAAAARSTQP